MALEIPLIVRVPGRIHRRNLHFPSCNRRFRVGLVVFAEKLRVVRVARNVFCDHFQFAVQIHIPHNERSRREIVGALVARLRFRRFKP